MSQELDLEKIYSNEDVLKSAVKYFDGDELAGNVWMNKYALKDAKGNFYELNPSHMHRRLGLWNLLRLQRSRSDLSFVMTLAFGTLQFPSTSQFL